MKLMCSARLRILDEILNQPHADYVACYYPEIGLIEIRDFDYSQILSARNSKGINCDALDNYAIFAHELTHFYQSIGTVYGVDRTILGIANVIATCFLLNTYRYQSPLNPRGKHFPIADFARAELRALVDGCRNGAPGFVEIEGPPGSYEILNYFARTETLAEAFEGLPPIPLSRIQPTLEWEQLNLANYLSWVTHGAGGFMEWVHLLSVPAGYRHGHDGFAISIGARAIEESWAAAIEAISLNQAITFPQPWRERTEELKSFRPDSHDYHVAFDYVADKLGAVHGDSLLPVFLVCADIALTYSGIHEHNFFPIAQLPVRFSGLRAEFESEESKEQFVFLPIPDHHIATPAEVFTKAVEAAKRVKPLNDDLARDLSRFLGEVIQTMGLEPIQSRLSRYLDVVLLPVLQNVQSDRKRWRQSADRTGIDPDELRLNLCVQALRLRMLYPDFFINVWNGDYRRRLQQQFRPLSLIDPTGVTNFTPVSGTRSFLESFFISHLIKGRHAECPKAVLGLAALGRFRCALEDQNHVHQGRRQLPVCDEKNYEDLETLRSGQDGACVIKILHDLFRLGEWEQPN